MNTYRRFLLEKLYIHENSKNDWWNKEEDDENKRNWKSLQNKYDIEYGGDGSGKYFTSSHIDALKSRKYIDADNKPKQARPHNFGGNINSVRIRRDESKPKKSNQMDSLYDKPDLSLNKPQNPKPIKPQTTKKKVSFRDSIKPRPIYPKVNVNRNTSEHYNNGYEQALIDVSQMIRNYTTLNELKETINKFL